MKEQGDGLLGVLTVVAQASGDGVMTSAMEQTQGSATQHTEDTWPLPHMDQAGILPQAHILGPMAAILNQPVLALELQKPLRRPDLRGQAGDPVAHLLMPLALLPPGPLDAEELGDAGPLR
jgi:hypothetical protein